MTTNLPPNIQCNFSRSKTENFDFQSSFARSLACGDDNNSCACVNGTVSDTIIPVGESLNFEKDSHCVQICSTNKSDEQSDLNESKFFNPVSTEKPATLSPINKVSSVKTIAGRNTNDDTVDNQVQHGYADSTHLLNANRCLKEDALKQIRHSTSENDFSSKFCNFVALKQQPEVAEPEVLRLRKECQNLVEENRQLMMMANTERQLNVHMQNESGDDDAVEMVILQSQVESLQWQLKQVESSRQMYHAVMEEVVRFLERCHHSLNALNDQDYSSDACARYKHTITASTPALATNNNESPAKATSIENQSLIRHLRLRTSTANSFDQTKALEQTRQSSDSSMLITANPSVNESYSNFRDFTWRRSPKGARQQQLDRYRTITENNGVDLDPEKLSQEAFRLLRTTQNLINLKEPILSDVKLPPQRLDYDLITKTTGNGSTAQHSSILYRKNNSRESRLSIQSSTDDSIHSMSSSSRTETDEETRNNSTINVNSAIGKQTISYGRLSSSSSTSSSSGRLTSASAIGVLRKSTLAKFSNTSNLMMDDESGFSSMNSFQEIGIPLTTPVQPLPPPVISALSTFTGIDKEGVLAAAATDNTNKVTKQNQMLSSSFAAQQMSSILLDKYPHIHHRRWSSAPPLPPKRAGDVGGLSTFTIHKPMANNEASSTAAVLWV